MLTTFSFSVSFIFCKPSVTARSTLFEMVEAVLDTSSDKRSDIGNRGVVADDFFSDAVYYLSIVPVSHNHGHREQ